MNKFTITLLTAIFFSAPLFAKTYQWEEKCSFQLETKAKLHKGSKRLWNTAIPKAKYIPKGSPVNHNKIGSYVEYHGAYATSKGGYKILRGICAFSENSGTHKVPGKNLLASKVIYVQPVASPFKVSTRKLQMRRFHRWVAGTADGTIGDTVAGGSNSPYVAVDKRNHKIIDCRFAPSPKFSEGQIDFRCSIAWRVDFPVEEYGKKFPSEYRTCRHLHISLKKGKTSPLTTLGSYDNYLDACYKTLRAPPKGY